MKDPKLGSKALKVFLAAEQGRARIYLPSIALAELYYLNEKLGRPLDFRSEFEVILRAAQFQIVPFAVPRCIASMLWPQYRRCTTGSLRMSRMKMGARA